MTGLLGSMSIDGTPISAADRARMEAEEALHAERQRQAVRIVAGRARDVADAKLLLEILGLDVDVIRQARADAAAAVEVPIELPVEVPAASRGSARGKAAAKPRKRTAA